MRTTGKFMRFAEKIFEFALGFLGGFMAPPRDTPAQAEQKEKAATNEETLHAQGYAASVQAKEAEYDAQAHAEKTKDQYHDLMASKITGRTPTREANVGREHEIDDYERGRERRRERER